MSDPTVRGVVHLIEPTKSYGKSDFRKRLVVLEQDKGRFTNYIPLDFVHEGCDAVDELSEGDEVEVTYRLSGRRWQRDPASEVKFFISAEATEFKILKKSGGQPASPAVSTKPPSVGDDEEEIPF